MTVTSPKGTRSLDLTESTFKTTVGTNDKGVTAVTQVVQTRTEDDEVETSRYSDQDGDGVFTETFELEVRTTTPTSTHRGTQHQFTFNADGTIASDTLVLATGETRVDAIETGEKYLRTTIDGRTYVVKTVAKGTEYHFEFFRDDNGDGKWTEVAEGHGDASAIDAATQMVSLVGLTPLLQAANAVVG